jgi:hypothetical protein
MALVAEVLPYPEPLTILGIQLVTKHQVVMAAMVSVVFLGASAAAVVVAVVDLDPTAHTVVQTTPEVVVAPEQPAEAVEY